MINNFINNFTKMTLLSAALAAFLLPAAAQTSNGTPANSTAPAATSAPATASAPAAAASTSTTPDKVMSVQERKDLQQKRIANGVANGSLTGGETQNLETKESDLNKEENQMKALDNGHLTAADRATLKQQQNQVSKQIYEDKHNAQSQPADPKTEFGQRRENQQDRISQGVKSGQLTAGEASQLEKQEGQVTNEVRADRAANGGKLTPAERAQVNSQQNKVSKQIYKDKHNNKKQ
jgi:hypothetical protein